MTPEEKLELDLRDIWRIVDGIETYLKLSPEETHQRLKAHEEDKLCTVTGHSGSGDLLCTRDAINAIFELAERHVNSLPVPEDHSVDEIAAGIRKHIARAMVEEKADEPTLAHVLKAAVEGAESSYVERTFHLPCVLIRNAKPVQFCIGPVVFTSASAVPQVMETAFGQYVTKSKNSEWSLELVERFKKHVSNLGWIASITVPPCSEESARIRSDLAVTSAINLVRLLMGVRHGNDIRLAHAAQSKPTETLCAIERSGELQLSLSRTVSGALIGGNWPQLLGEHQEYWNRGGHLLCTTVKAKRSEVARRVIDALTWFGEAAFENAPGTQIVKFVTALERLTTTRTFSTHEFCARVAFLAYEDEADFERYYRDASNIYAARCQVVHGDISPSNPTFLKCLRLAHDITRNALIRSLEVHCILDDDEIPSNLEDLNKFFEGQLSKKVGLLSRLRERRKPSPKKV